jgi:hypothetical protein
MKSRKENQAMKKKVFFLHKRNTNLMRISLVMFFVFGSLILWGVAPLGAMQLQLSFDEITNQADVIFIGTVVEQQSRYGANQNMVFTDVRFDVVELIYSIKQARDIIGKEIELSFAGGEMEGVTFKVSDVPTFEIGATYVVFTRMDGKIYASPTIGAYQGLFKVASDEVSGVLYPLTYGGHSILEIRDNDLITGPRVSRILYGKTKAMVEEEPFKIHSVPPQPAQGMQQTNARAQVSKVLTEKPEGIMSLDDFLSEIHARLQMGKRIDK